MNIKLPDGAQYIITVLEENGYEAYVVGGCVRDAVLGGEPKDWDICTSALPEQTMKCFDGQRIIETGLKHGTITVMVCHRPFEVTTYRVDRKYKDNRRPEKVEFVNVLKRDLARRDFTINAMAYNPKTGLVDYYGGRQDLAERKIKCVGNADKRFQEDALRIMRALRLASALGFSIDETTSEAVFRNRGLLRNISVERFAAELNKLIVGGAEDVLLKYSPVIEEIIPEIKDMIGFRQNNPYHHLDVWTHTVKSVVNAPVNPVLRLTMLLHDIAKPNCFTEDGNLVGHFYGHPKISADMASEILKRLKYDNGTIEMVVELVLHHDADVLPRRKHIKRWLNRIGETRLRQLLEVKRADAMAQSETYRQAKLDVLEEIPPIIDEIIEQRQCFSLKDLAVNGRDLIGIGVPEGVEIGKALKVLLGLVIDEVVENDKAKLLNVAKKAI